MSVNALNPALSASRNEGNTTDEEAKALRLAMIALIREMHHQGTPMNEILEYIVKRYGRWVV